MFWDDNSLILVGSAATSDFDHLSDLDLVLIAAPSTTALEIENSIPQAALEHKLGRRIDLTVYSQETCQDLYEGGSTKAWLIYRLGKPLVINTPHCKMIRTMPKGTNCSQLLIDCLYLTNALLEIGRINTSTIFSFACESVIRSSFLAISGPFPPRYAFTRTFNVELEDTGLSRTARCWVHLCKLVRASRLNGRQVAISESALRANLTSLRDVLAARTQEDNPSTEATVICSRWKRIYRITKLFQIFDEFYLTLYILSGNRKRCRETLLGGSCYLKEIHMTVLDSLCEVVMSTEWISSDIFDRLVSQYMSELDLFISDAR